ncbi:MAG: helix-turn-helix transcriptional regulator [Candidatus Omnitrophota bacterium]
MNDATTESREMGLRIRQVRKKLGLLQADLANKVRIPTVTLSAIECGKIQVCFDLLYNLDTLYNINLDYVFHGKGEIFKQKPTIQSDVERELDDVMDGIGPILWFMENSPIFRNQVRHYTLDYLFQNKSMIKDDILLSGKRNTLNQEMEAETAKLLNSQNLGNNVRG